MKCVDLSNSKTVMPAQAGTQPARVCATYESLEKAVGNVWIRAEAGMTT
jgi:hypothetical protein